MGLTHLAVFKNKTDGQNHLCTVTKFHPNFNQISIFIHTQCQLSHTPVNVTVKNCTLCTYVSQPRPVSLFSQCAAIAYRTECMTTATTTPYDLCISDCNTTALTVSSAVPHARQSLLKQPVYLFPAHILSVQSIFTSYTSLYSPLLTLLLIDRWDSTGSTHPDFPCYAEIRTKKNTNTPRSSPTPADVAKLIHRQLANTSPTPEQ